MSLKVVGAGVGRTGTLSLKSALEKLIGRPCYHMLEVFTHPEHVRLWSAAAADEKVDWATALADYGATSDFPACLFWAEILDANPEAIVVLSSRSDAEAWWDSASKTIFSIDGSQIPPEMSEWFEMWRTVSSARFTSDWTDKASAIAAYERHNAQVRSSAPPDRLVEWRPDDGWEPLCGALGLEVPGEPFPHLNKREDFPTVDADTSLPDAIENFKKGAAG